MPSSHLILCHLLLLQPPIPPSIRVFSNESTLHMRWLKYWSFSFSISPSNEYPGLIYFRMDWLDLLAVQGTLKSLLQHHHSKASILQCSAFFTVQLSYPCMTTGKTIALTRRTFVGKVISLLSNILSRLIHMIQLFHFCALIYIWRKQYHYVKEVSACPCSLQCCFPITKIWKQPKCPSTDEWRKNVPFGTTWMNIKGIMLDIVK